MICDGPAGRDYILLILPLGLAVYESLLQTTEFSPIPAFNTIKTGERETRATGVQICTGPTSSDNEDTADQCTRSTKLKTNLSGKPKVVSSIRSTHTQIPTSADHLLSFSCENQHSDYLTCHPLNPSASYNK